MATQLYNILLDKIFPFFWTAWDVVLMFTTEPALDVISDAFGDGTLSEAVTALVNTFTYVFPGASSMTFFDFTIGVPLVSYFAISLFKYVRGD